MVNSILSIYKASIHTVKTANTIDDSTINEGINQKLVRAFSIIDPYLIILNCKALPSSIIEIYLNSLSKYAT
jgi:hypothetical protein